MPNTRLIKGRIRSAQNIAKITKAMEMVSASKMRRAQSQAQASQPYAQKLHGVLHSIGQNTDSTLHPLLAEQPTGRPLLVVFSTDRGLCGALNNNLFKAIIEFSETHPNPIIITIGRKAQEFAARSGYDLTATFTQLPERPSFSEILPVAQMVRDGFLGDQYSSVHVAHMEFVNTLTQVPKITPLLPLQIPKLEAQNESTHPGVAQKDYKFEPTPQELLNTLLPYYVEVLLYQTLLDARASEHSARMISMQNASNNAKDVVGALRLEYNKSRQSAITQELIEITTTKENS